MKWYWLIIFFLVVILVVPFPNFYELCICPLALGFTDCSCQVTNVFVNGLMLFINFFSFNVYNRVGYFHINFSYFLISVPLSVLVSFILYKGVNNKKRVFRIVSWIILGVLSLVILYAIFGLLFLSFDIVAHK